MGSLDAALTRNANKENVVARVVDDTPVAIRIIHTDSDCTVTSVTVTTGTDIELIDGDGTSTLAFATYDTVGEVADAINALDNWECKVLDALRADATDGSELVDGAISSATKNGETVWDVCVDTSTAKAITYRCTFDRGVNRNLPKHSHMVDLREFTYNLNIDAADANGVRVYKWDASAKSESQVWQATSVDATDTTHNWASGEGMISAGWGNDLIVRIIADGTVTDASGVNFLECVYEKR